MEVFGAQQSSVAVFPSHFTAFASFRGQRGRPL